MDIAYLKNKKVLYVEDDDAIVKSFSKILYKIFGDVRVGMNGEEGLEIFKSEKDFDFVISDIKMPKMDGLEMTGEKFYWMLVDTLGGEIDVVASTDLCDELPNPLSIVQGQFWLSGRILD